jgi:hypothetical protein
MKATIFISSFTLHLNALRKKVVLYPHYSIDCAGFQYYNMRKELGDDMRPVRKRLYIGRVNAAR